ncbi:MAG: adenylosuccinate lyase [Planctomycetes bacterium]|nr:adenylosuccinate lyase [Planctomycetota bacterium]
MQRLWSDAHRAQLWRRVWLAVAQSQHELGVDIPKAAIDAMRDNLHTTDFAAVAHHEKRLRHDVMAHVHAFGESALAAQGFIHLGLTSQDVICNADALVLREALGLIAVKFARAIDRVATFAAKHRDLPCLGYTHFQPAQPLSLGKRATLWGQDFAIALEDIERRLAGVRLKGLRGATGTQFSFLALLGDAARVDQLEAKFCAHLQWNPDDVWSVCGQTSPRVFEATVLNALAVGASAIHKCCNDIRLLANLREVEEPFEKDQIGSSAMPYKRNPMRCERATGLARFVIGLASVGMSTASEQWLERTLDDSSARRLSLPEAFLALDGALDVMINVLGGLVVNESVIAHRLANELPFVATEDILIAAVRAGVDREKAHDSLRRHALAAADRVKNGATNDLASRLAGDPLLAKVDIARALDAKRLTGRSGEQTDRWIANVAAPFRKKYAATLAHEPSLKV